MGKEQGDLSHVIHRHWRGTSEITTSSLGLQDSRADKKHLWSDKLHIFVWKDDFDSIFRQFLHHLILKTTIYFLLTIESPSIFKTFPCFYPSLATINRTVDSSLGFDWLSNWWEILDINRAFSASPPGNALFFRRELPAQRPKGGDITKEGFVCFYGFIGTDLYHATNGKEQNPNFIECWGSHSHPPRATRKGAGIQAWPRLGSVMAWRWIWIVNFAKTYIL